MTIKREKWYKTLDSIFLANEFTEDSSETNIYINLEMTEYININKRPTKAYFRDCGRRTLNGRV